MASASEVAASRILASSRLKAVAVYTRLHRCCTSSFTATTSLSGPATPGVTSAQTWPTLETVRTTECRVQTLKVHIKGPVFRHPAYWEPHAACMEHIGDGNMARRSSERDAPDRAQAPAKGHVGMACINVATRLSEGAPFCKHGGKRRKVIGQLYSSHSCVLVTEAALGAHAPMNATLPLHSQMIHSLSTVAGSIAQASHCPQPVLHIV